MSPARRSCMVIVVVAFLAAAVVQAQRIVIGMAPGGPQSDTLATVVLPTNRQAQQVMAKGHELIDEKEYQKACEALQYLLSLKEDSFVKVARDGPGQKNEVLYVSIRSEANRLLGTMPAEGLKIYEQLVGREAAARLAEGRTANDSQILGEVAQRYFHTGAGAQATELLATRRLERAEFLMAALYFERLLARPDASHLAALTLFKAALAFHRNGDRAGCEQVWKLLTAKAKRDGGVVMGEQVVSLERLRAEIDQAAPEEPLGIHDWPNYRGAPDRSGQVIAGTIDLGNVAWDLSTLYLPTRDHPGKGWTDDLVNTGMQSLEKQNQPILPACHPIAVNGKVILSVYDGVYAADLRQKDEKLLWWAETDGGVTRSLGTNNPNQQHKIKEWWSNNQNQGYKFWGPQSILFENTVTGTLSTDSVRVFVVDDLPLLPHPLAMQNNLAMIGMVQPNPNSLEERARFNNLKCYNLESGKIMFDLGGMKPPEGVPVVDRFLRSRFLSAPLPMGGKFYLLNEKAGSINLVCLEAKGTSEDSWAEIAWDQRLADVKDGDILDLNRRLQAAHISYGEGFLVCPTNAGAVVAVDLLTRSLVWAHHYREAAPPQAAPQPGIRRPLGINPNRVNRIDLTNQWRHSAPAVAAGKVVFTAPDSADITCLNLRDGRLVWKHVRTPDDLYFAGICQGKVVTVGKNYVRAYQLTDGTKVWDSSEATGMPTGQGAFAGNVYYLPARNASREPEIVMVNLADGKITSHIKSEKKDLLGNLIFHDGHLISQTATGITAFGLK